jgi:hypothetical protein
MYAPVKALPASPPTSTLYFLLGHRSQRFSALSQQLLCLRGFVETHDDRLRSVSWSDGVLQRNDGDNIAGQQQLTVMQIKVDDNGSIVIVLEIRWDRR